MLIFGFEVAKEAQGPSTPLAIPFGNGKLRSG
jgi:hypothetical protein